MEWSDQDNRMFQQMALNLTPEPVADESEQCEMTITMSLSMWQKVVEANHGLKAESVQRGAWLWVSGAAIAMLAGVIAALLARS